MMVKLTPTIAFSLCLFFSCSKDSHVPIPKPRDVIDNHYHITVRSDVVQYVAMQQSSGKTTGWSTLYPYPDKEMHGTDTTAVFIRRKNKRLQEKIYYSVNGPDSTITDRLTTIYYAQQRIQKILHFGMSENDSLVLKKVDSFTHYANDRGYGLRFIYYNIPGHSEPNSDYGESHISGKIKAKVDINWLGYDEYGLKPKFLLERHSWGGRGGPSAFWPIREYRYQLSEDGYVIKRKIVSYTKRRSNANTDTITKVDSFSYTIVN